MTAWSQPLQPPRINQIRGSYTSTQNIYPFIGSHNLHALGISGSVTLNSDTSLVRVLMKDYDGKTYLMYEATLQILNAHQETFTDANEETTFLCGITPSYLIFVVKDASLNISNLNYTYYDGTIHKPKAPALVLSDRISRAQEKADAINSYNRTNNIIWRAGVTNLSTKSYDEKKRLLGISQDDANMDLAYYQGGIFELGSRTATNPNLEALDRAIVDYFDWHNRPGNVNWMTDVKDQGSSSYCTLFSSVGLVEAMTNLYFNQHLDFNLSEEDVALYNSQRSADYIYSLGWDLDGAFSYIADYGVTTEDCIPIQMTKDYHEKDPIRPTQYPLIQITGSTAFAVMWSTFNKPYKIKQQLIQHGPISVDMTMGMGRHSAILTGFNRIHAGDTIALNYTWGGDYSVADHYIVQENDDYDGKTYWIIKNSYGKDNYGYGHDGYLYAIINDYDIIEQLYTIETPIYGSLVENINRVIEDNDGDGYYTWGIGEKPENAPLGVPDRQDGDDTDAFKGPLDENGHTEDLTYYSTNPLYIESDTIFDEFMYLKHPIVVRNGATLTIKSVLKCTSTGSITLQDGSHLVLEGGDLQGITVLGNSASDLKIDGHSYFEISRDKNNHLQLHR